MNDWSTATHKPTRRPDPPAPTLDTVIFRLVGPTGKPVRCATYFVATGVELRVEYEHDPDAPFQTQLFKHGQEEAIAELAASWRAKFDGHGFKELAILE